MWGDNRFSAQTYLLKAVRDLGSLLDQEVDAISSADTQQLRDVTDRKGSLLVKLTSCLATIDEQKMGDEERNALNFLSDKLASSRRQIEAHMNATREITDAMIEMIKAQDGDGTYSAMKASVSR